MVNIGLVGFGYWGPNLCRNLSNNKFCTLAAICDSDSGRLSVAKTLYPSASVTIDPLDIILNKKIDAIVIATPVSTHFSIAKAALMNGKHVLIEKPMTYTSDEAKELIDISIKFSKVLMVDHTFLYTGAVKKIKELIDFGELGNLQYFDSTRVNLGLVQRDINVLWDLAPHDLSILFHLTEKFPRSINATGGLLGVSNHNNIGHITLNYDDDFIAFINCSWLSPVKIRKILIGGDSKMITYDDIEPSDKVRVYDSGLSYLESDKNLLNIEYRTGDILIPKLQNTEALSLVVDDFINSISNPINPLSNSIIGANIVTILEASSQSIMLFGKNINIQGKLLV